MDKTIARYNKSIISIGNDALTNRMYDFKNEVNYLKYIRLKRSKDLYNHFLNQDLDVLQTDEEIKEILNKISFE